MTYLRFITKYPVFKELEEETYRLWELDAIEEIDRFNLPANTRDRAIELKIACALSSSLFRTPDQLKNFSLREDGYSVAYGESDGAAGGSEFCKQYQQLLLSFGKTSVGGIGYRDRDWINSQSVPPCACRPSCWNPASSSNNPFA